MTGTPGVGKTTIAKKLAEILGFKLLDLNKLAEEIGGIGDYDAKRDTWRIKEEKIREKLYEILGEGVGFVIEGHWGDLVPEEYVRCAIVLRTNPLVLMERLKKKGYKKEKVKENAQAELLDYCLIKAVEEFGEDRVFEVDSTSGDVNAVIEEVLNVVKEGKGKRAGSINWIKTLEREGKIMELLS
ncbi:MAG: adenylate kinase family protein [Candidatus Methanomethyliaceae archaeon]|nr:adenylate kinase family protein [Candidatus Methanomethyliaceae archaeon]